ncbi:MAG: hypothetical protein IPK85_24195 [Gemmatimonadetes bacterium]|nr:hypothetical protein [Gemmatimonadota bacterium]
MTATYDARGRIVSQTAPAPSGVSGTTSVTWEPKWDQVTRITNPSGDYTEFGISTTNGNRLWQQDNRGLPSRDLQLQRQQSGGGGRRARRQR